MNDQQKIFDIGMIRTHYKSMAAKIDETKRVIGRPLSLAEKILYSHLTDGKPSKENIPDYIKLGKAVIEYYLKDK